MKLGLSLGMGKDWRESIEIVKRAEDLGYELVIDGEAWGPSVIPWLAAIAVNTSKINIAPSILNCYSRSPSAIAQEFAALEVLSGGRMVLGLGTSAVNVIEHFHGYPYSMPLRRLREYVEIFNMLIKGDKLHYQGKIFQMERGFELNYERPRNHVPVFIAAITPLSILQTGEIADGIYPIHWPIEKFFELRNQLTEGASAASRGNVGMTIAPRTKVTILTGNGDDLKWRSARQPLHHYINRMGKFYWEMLERNGFEDEVSASRSAWEDRNLEGAISAISERMIRSVQVIGDWSEARDQLKQRALAGADVQILDVPQGSLDETTEFLEQAISS